MPVTKNGYRNKPLRNLQSYTGLVPTKFFDFSKPSGSLGTGTKRLTFPEFIRQANPLYQFYTHTNKLIAVGQRIVDGELKRVIFTIPPRHSKSETISRLLSAYYLHCHPDHYVGLTSYAADLAYMLSRNARDNYQRAGNELSANASAVSLWETGKGGGLWATGVGGPLTGKGFRLGIIDDPLKSSEEAQSATIREKQKDWYRSAFYTRQEPGAAIIVIQTRWHEDDLTGWLLSRESEEPQHWHIVDFPAVAEALPDFPATCTVEPEWRQPDEPLCRERFSRAKLREIERDIGPYFWAALYQQRPYARTGGLFERQWFQSCEVLPSDLHPVRYWDLAATAQSGHADPDYTAGAKVAAKEGRIYIIDLKRTRNTPQEVEKLIKQTAELDGRATPIWIEQEPGAGSKALIDYYQRQVLAGYAVRPDKVGADKRQRAGPLSAAAQAGNVLYPKGATWVEAFLDEAEAFPNGAHDDQVDAVSGAMQQLTQVGWARGPAA